MWLLLLIFTLLHLHHVHSYEVTQYYQVVTVTEREGTVIGRYTRPAYLATTAQFITPTASGIPSPLTVQTSIPQFDVTFVKAQLPTGAGDPIPKQTSSSSTRMSVPITYSTCTSYSSGKDYLVPPVTKSAAFYVTPAVAATLSALSSFYTEESKSYYTATSTIAVKLVDPAALDPIAFASLSRAYQPHNCLTATAKVDYRDACSAGPTYRMKGTGCGELNPCCFDCSEYEWRCLVGHCTDHTPGETFRRCADGVDYYAGSVTSVDKKYTKALPKNSKGEWSGVQTTGGNPNEPTSTQSGGASRTDGSVWLWGYLVLLISWLL